MVISRNKSDLYYMIQWLKIEIKISNQADLGINLTFSFAKNRLIINFSSVSEILFKILFLVDCDLLKLKLNIAMTITIFGTQLDYTLNQTNY